MRTALATFEVTVSVEQANPASWVTQADNWVDAWRDALRRMGQRDMPDDAQFESVGIKTHIFLEQQRLRFMIAPVSFEDSAPRGRRDTQELSAPRAKDMTAEAPGEQADAPVDEQDAQLNALFEEIAHERARFAERRGTLETHEAKSEEKAEAYATKPGLLIKLGQSERLPQQFRCIASEPIQEREALYAWVLNSMREAIAAQYLFVVEQCDEALVVLSSLSEEAGACDGYHMHVDQGMRQLVVSSATRLKVKQARTLTLQGEFSLVLEFSSLIQVPVPESSLRLIILEAERSSGFLDRDLRLVSYFAKMLHERLRDLD